MTDPLDAFDPPAPSGRRGAVIADLAGRLAHLGVPGRAVVALDGVDGAGKTVLGRELSALLRGVREVHRVSADGFHLPEAVRFRHGRTAETFYRESRDHAALVTRCLRPFRAGAPFATAVHDVWSDSAVEALSPPAGEGALLLVDGIFLQRPELDGEWDAVVWVEAPFEVALRRGNARFGRVGDEEADPDAPGNARYVGGQRLYLTEADPRGRATWLLDNTDLAAPTLRPGRGVEGGTPGRGDP